MNRSSLGTAAAREKVRRTRQILRMYSALRWKSGWTLINNNNENNPQIYLPSPPLENGIQKINWNIELEGEREKYREGHHYLHQDCQAVKEKKSSIETYS